MSVRSPRQVLQAWHAAFVARDVEALVALYHDDAINHQVAEAPLQGKAALRASFTGFFAAFPHEATDVLGLFEDGEWAMWMWRGGFPGAPSTPELHGCGFFHVVDGRIKLQRGYWDKLSFLRLHGLPLES